MKRFLKITTVVAMMAIAWACAHDDTVVSDVTPDVGGSTEVADGSLVRVRFGVKIPDPISVATRAVDPDGNGIQTMTLFCFDGEGLLISTATATLEPDTDESGGILDADIPNTTRIIHLLANQNMAQFKEDEFRNMSEDQVIANLEGSSGMMIYWARVEVPSKVVGSDGILTWITVMTNPEANDYNGLKGEDFPIIMLRNQAKVMVDAGGTTQDVEKDWNGSSFVVTGFTVVNTQAFGTVAPYHTTYGYPTYACEIRNNTGIANANDWAFTPEFGLTVGNAANWRAIDYVNLPSRSDKLSNIVDVDTEAQTYVFETENSSADPVSVIIRGKNVVNGVEQGELYYRVTMTDADGQQVLVRRNHLYTINIVGNLQYGVSTFGEAIDAPASNNVWLSISDEVKSVQDKEFKLAVATTGIVLDEEELREKETATTPASLTLDFSVEQLGNAAIDINDLQVSWVDARQDVSSTHNFPKSKGTGSTVYFPVPNQSTKGTVVNGTITITLNQFEGVNADKDIMEGTLLVKYGRLQRKIRIVSVRIQKFTPAWVTSQVYNQTGSTQSNATLLFTIPDDCPSLMFPMKVLISTNELDIRNETGQVLPIIRKGEEGYGEDNGIGYKYVYEVAEPGAQFIYMKSILKQDAGSSNDITIEAAHFESVTKKVVYADHQRAITVTNVTSSETPTGKPEDKIYYVYLPQKKNAPWAINLNMMNVATGESQSVNQGDEFLLYSQNLDAYADSEFSIAKRLLPDDSWLSQSTYFPCQFRAYSPDTWSSGGRVFAFMPRYTYYETYKFATSDGQTMRSHFSVYMKTNKAKSAEIIRISSNQLEAKAAFLATIPNNPTTKPETDTNTTIYSNNDDDNWTYSQKGTVSTYRSMIFELRNYPAFRFAAQVRSDGVVKPQYDVATLPDLSNNAEVETPVEISYEPGTRVEVSFDVTDFVAADGKSVDPFGSEFKVYIQTPNFVLAPDQSSQITHVGNGLYEYLVSADRATEAAGWSTTPLQSDKAGERKVIAFLTRDIVTEGNIEIYTDINEVGYMPKVFTVTNKQISGTITYGDGTPLPANTFVSFSRELDGSRIGSITVTSNGNYELRLRKEYEFTWAQNDPVKLYARVEGQYYSATYANLEALYASPNVVLTLQQETDGE